MSTSNSQNCLLQAESHEGVHGREVATVHTPCYLDALPTELILEVAEWLQSGSAFLSLGASSFRFREVLKLARVPAPDAESRATFRNYLRLDDLCERERKGLLRMSGKVCSGCVDVHHFLKFPASELHIAPHRRLCFGQRGRFRLCEHATFDYRDIAKWSSGKARPMSLMGPLEWYKGDIICLHASHASHAHDFYDLPRMTRLEYQRGVNSGFFLHRNMDLLFRLDPSQETRTSPEALRKRLAAIDLRVCPHKFLSDPNLFQGTPESEIEDFAREHRCSLSIPCSLCDGRDGRLGTDKIRIILRDWSRRGVFLCLSREMSLPKNPNSVEWLSNLEIPRQA
ncbi:hypothetical protein SLS58_006045 [Diplodia intermedia]|uniref:F-box domain-containing protein n=1 Tax=Diplodia intermedia TaxID=856260 RepID=A0ABR3TP66_9PEZI